ncbi:DUF5694 domain-containing protein [Rossellomorea aquimaris]|uniref:TraB family protein n=1 Tax=Rossellomorea aquimaris TaxID=189382 RepID=A0A5D4TI92_9BACI|nr:DUF5694 domain-containing protein [Rossellomorea aquimaris]TYS75520.1 hypothetical protein FZC80_17155 [Rossellomorea aquimaris]
MVKKEIILLGTFHMEQYEAELIIEKEKEIMEMVGELIKLQPKKVALEWDRAIQTKLQERYTQCKVQYSQHEMEQIGFRAAKALGLKEVHAVDWEGTLTQEDVTDLFMNIEKGYPVIREKIQVVKELSPSINKKIRMMDSYKALNNYNAISELERLYLSFALVEDPNGKNIGMEFLTKWMEREYKIYKNIAEVAAMEGNNRILLLIGSDHLWMLKTLFEGSGWKVLLPFSE